MRSKSEMKGCRTEYILKTSKKWCGEGTSQRLFSNACFCSINKFKSNSISYSFQTTTHQNPMYFYISQQVLLAFSFSLFQYVQIYPQASDNSTWILHRYGSALLPGKRYACISIVELNLTIVITCDGTRQEQYADLFSTVLQLHTSQIVGTAHRQQNIGLLKSFEVKTNHLHLTK